MPDNIRGSRHWDKCASARRMYGGIVEVDKQLILGAEFGNHLGADVLLLGLAEHEAILYPGDSPPAVLGQGFFLSGEFTLYSDDGFAHTVMPNASEMMAVIKIIRSMVFLLFLIEAQYNNKLKCSVLFSLLIICSFNYTFIALLRGKSTHVIVTFLCLLYVGTFHLHGECGA